MRFSVARSELLDALSLVSKGLSSRSTLPILSGILVTAEGSDLTMQSTDLEISIQHSLPALVEGEGRAVVPGRLLSDIVRNLPEAAVSVELENELVHVRCGHASFTVKTLPAGEFPRFPEVVPDSTVALPTKTLESTVRQVSKAVSRDETRAILTGILLSVDGHDLRLVATDSYRLAVREVTLDVAIEASLEVVVPGKALEEVARMAAGTDEVQIGISENQLLFTFGSTTFVTRRVEGSYPNWRNLIPAEATSVVTMSTEEMLGAVKRVSLMALQNSPLKVSVKSEDKTLSLSATAQDVGDASEDLMVEVDGEDVEIAFNPGFLVDGLTSAPTETITLSAQSPLKPGLLRSVGEEGFVYLLMPVRLT
jgi:DNA polymerase-3 subunit beta